MTQGTVSIENKKLAHRKRGKRGHRKGTVTGIFARLCMTEEEHTCSMCENLAVGVVWEGKWQQIMYTCSIAGEGQQ